MTRKQFENELNERINFTVECIKNNETLNKVFQLLPIEKQVELTSMLFLATAVEKGSEQAFIENVMKLSK